MTEAFAAHHGRPHRVELADRLQAHPRPHVMAVGKAAGVPGKIVDAAIKARPVAADYHMRLCVAFGLDPAPDLNYAVASLRPASFDHALLGMALGVRRRLNGDRLRDAGEAMGISHVTVTRLEHGHIMSIGVVIKACRYVGIHPFGYLKSGNVPCETRTVTSQSAGVPA